MAAGTIRKPEYSLETMSRASYEIQPEEMERISRYTRRGVNAMLRRDLTSEHAYWRTLTEAVQVLYHHPDPIVRHESAFVLSDFPYRRDLEKVTAVRRLRLAVRLDPSVVVQHEALEALGEIFCIASVGAAADAAKIIGFPQRHHPDVIATARETLDSLLGYLRREGYRSAVRTIRQWSRPSR
jgi:hypothetical protein